MLGRFFFVWRTIKKESGHHSLSNRYMQLRIQRWYLRLPQRVHRLLHRKL